MAAGLGFKTFTTGEVLTAADTNGYLMQGVNVFADAAARTAAITSPQEGQMSYLKDTNSTEYYSGSAWTAVAGASGGMTLISTTTLSGATTTLSSIPQTYNSLFLVISGVSANTSDNRLRCLPNNVSNSGNYSSVVNDVTYSETNQAIRLTVPNSLRTNSANGWALTIDNYTSTSALKPFNYSGFYVDTASTNTSTFAGGAYRSNTAITSLVFDYGGTNTFIGGTVLLYGVK